MQQIFIKCLPRNDNKEKGNANDRVPKIKAIGKSQKICNFENLKTIIMIKHNNQSITVFAVCNDTLLPRLKLTRIPYAQDKVSKDAIIKNKLPIVSMVTPYQLYINNMSQDVIGLEEHLLNSCKHRLQKE